MQKEREGKKGEINKHRRDEERWNLIQSWGHHFW
jgi:hypothetical protein